MKYLLLWFALSSGELTLKSEQYESLLQCENARAVKAQFVENAYLEAKEKYPFEITGRFERTRAFALQEIQNSKCMKVGNDE